MLIVFSFKRKDYRHFFPPFFSWCLRVLLVYSSEVNSFLLQPYQQSWCACFDLKSFWQTCLDKRFKSKYQQLTQLPAEAKILRALLLFVVKYFLYFLFFPLNILFLFSIIPPCLQVIHVQRSSARFQKSVKINFFHNFLFIKEKWMFNHLSPKDLSGVFSVVSVVNKKSVLIREIRG